MCLWLWVPHNVISVDVQHDWANCLNHFDTVENTGNPSQQTSVCKCKRGNNHMRRGKVKEHKTTDVSTAKCIHEYLHLETWLRIKHTTYRTLYKSLFFVPTAELNIFSSWVFSGLSCLFWSCVGGWFDYYLVWCMPHSFTIYMYLSTAKVMQCSLVQSPYYILH